MAIIYCIVFIILIFVGTIIYGATKGTATAVKESGVRAENAEKYDASITARLKHVGGLPLAEGMLIDLYAARDRLIVKKDEQEITVASGKLRSFDDMTGKDIQTMAGGAAAGLLLFGLTGAAIGALAASNRYMVVAYESNGEQKYITFEVPAALQSPAKKLTDYYGLKDAAKTQHIEL